MLALALRTGRVYADELRAIIRIAHRVSALDEIEQLSALAGRYGVARAGSPLTELLRCLPVGFA